MTGRLVRDFKTQYSISPPPQGQAQRSDAMQTGSRQRKVRLVDVHVANMLYMWETGICLVAIHQVIFAFKLFAVSTLCLVIGLIELCTVNPSDWHEAHGHGHTLKSTVCISVSSPLLYLLVAKLLSLFLGCTWCYGESVGCDGQ